MISWKIFSIGLVAQLLFTGRFLFQWLASEKAKTVVTPCLFWKLSLLGSALLMLYGYLRKDPVIIFGQLLIYAIYIRNLQLQQQWRHLSAPLRMIICLLPLAAFYFLGLENLDNHGSLFTENEIPLWLLMLGFVGQVIFSLRFIVQWIISEKRKTSLLPVQFWILSLAGSGIIILYAVFRKDPVLLLGHIAGIFIYLRNISLSHSHHVSG